MNSMQAQEHIDECRRMLQIADQSTPSDVIASQMIGRLIMAIDQLAAVVEDLARREQGAVIA